MAGEWRFERKKMANVMDAILAPLRTNFCNWISRGHLASAMRVRARASFCAFVVYAVQVI